MNSGNQQTKGMTPLWVISLFVSLSEVVTGIAVTQANGGIQVTLTVFVVVFPILVATAFFVILWTKPYVFYSPNEFGPQTDVTKYVDAMRHRNETDAKMTELVQASIKDAFNSTQMAAKLEETLKGAGSLSEKKIADALKSVGETALSALEMNTVTIDPTPIAGRKSKLRQVPYDPNQPVGRFLDDVWFSLEDKVPAYQYDKVWILRDKASGFELRDAGRSWATKHGQKEDLRPIREVGIRPGMHLKAVRV